MKNPMLKRIAGWYRSLVLDPAMRFDFHRTYPRQLRGLKKSHPYDEAMKLAAGGEFEAVGILERELLIQCGLNKNGYVIDVGCGSGRLAKPLAQYLDGQYLGIDVVPELIEYARRLVQRPDWRFEVARGLSIPEEDGKADMVCFFSVFTHLLHEQTYTYLGEARRVLKPGGKIVFSFHEFAVSKHWELFEASLTARNPHRNPLHMFIGRDAIQAWAAHLNLGIEIIQDGDKPHIPLSRPVVFENGRVMRTAGNLGQSVCVLTLEP